MTASTDVIERPEMADFLPDNLPTRTGEVEAEVAEAQAKAEAIEVTNEAEAQAALAASKEINRRTKAIEEERVSLTKPRKDAAEEIKCVYDEMKAPFVKADQVIRSKLAAFEEKRKREAQERQRRIEEERERVEAKARAEREAAEQAQREAAALAAEAKAEEDAKAAAELAEEARREAERAQVTEQAIQALPAQAAPDVPKLDGFSQREQWEAEVVDFAALPDTLPDGTPLKTYDKAALRRWMYARLKENPDVAPELPGAKFEKRPAGTTVRV